MAGSEVKKTFFRDILKIVFVLANNVDPHGMPYYAVLCAFYLGIHYLLNFTFGNRLNREETGICKDSNT